MDQSMEPRIRALVAHHLGVGMDDLRGDVSLVDDLAADSLDLVEIALAVEDAFAIAIPERVIDQVRTYADLVDVAVDLVARRHASIQVEVTPLLVRARIFQPDERARPLERDGWLTPYAAETMCEDALRLGTGARLEITVPPATTDVELASVRERFTRLGPRNVGLTVRRDGAVGLAQPAHPSAA